MFGKITKAKAMEEVTAWKVEQDAMTPAEKINAKMKLNWKTVRQV